MFFGLAKGFGALTDIVATAALCVYLSSSRTGVTQTNSIIKTLVHFIIHRGALVTLIQSLLLIMFFAVPTRLYWLAFHVNVTKLYVNIFFALLNARLTLNEKIHQGTVMRMNDSFRLASSTEIHRDKETNIVQPTREKLYPVRPVINISGQTLMSMRVSESQSVICVI